MHDEDDDECGEVKLFFPHSRRCLSSGICFFNFQISRKKKVFEMLMFRLECCVSPHSVEGGKEEFTKRKKTRQINV